MAGLFGQSAPKLPTPAPPPRMPEVSDATADYAARLARMRSGFKKTILTGDLSPDTGKKKLLGG